MFNFFRAKMQRWRSNQSREDLQYFVDMLKGADIEGRALTVALATDFRNKVLDTSEFLDARAQGVSTQLLLKFYHDLQKANMLPNAAGVAIWLHTERALHDLTLVPLAKEMWALLKEAFPLVEDAGYEYELIGGHQLDLDLFGEVPTGFE